MFTHESFIRVRYGETDQMGFVYYGNYPLYYEVGRVEAMRKLGIPYKVLEERGVMLPVKKMTIEYKRPALYDDLIRVVTTVPETPSTTLRFEHKLYNEQGELLNIAEVLLVFVDSKTKRPCRTPSWLLETLKENGFEGE